MQGFSYNNKYILRDGEPWFPVMGELHYSRYPKRYWREAILKMKAGGVDIVSTYVIWIHHEEVQGEYDFTGNKDLREFVQICRECGVYLFLRIGPWCHGEVRNGGFPDWLLSLPVRTNDERYLAEAERFYRRIYAEVEGCFYPDGGAIIGIQIENEYGHCGGLQGDEGEAHMRRLAGVAREIGFDAPLYTATGWGGAVTGGLLPVMGGYCEAPWDQRLTSIEPSGNYLFTHERNDHNIGSDYGFGHGITFDTEKFPYLTAELGGGLQVTYHRRPVAHAEDIGAMSLAKLGSGVTLLGYYMYHGGTNPKGRLTTLQESRATGYLNDLPEYSYDFNAPIREYGQISETYKEIKLLAMFLKDFGSALCETETIIPEDNPTKADDFESLRYSVREKDGSGYVFYNNFQRRESMKRHEDVTLPHCKSPVTLEDGAYGFYPFHMPLGGYSLENVLASPLCILNGKTYVFYGDGAGLPGELPDGFETICLTREQAKNAYKISLDKEYLVISDNAVIEDEAGYKAFCGELHEIVSYPELGALSGIDCHRKEAIESGSLKGYRLTMSGEKPSVHIENLDGGRYRISITRPENASDVFLKISYSGDMAKLYVAGVQEGDSFFTGEPWVIGLKRFGLPESVEIEIFPMEENAPVFLEKKPVFKNGVALELHEVEVCCEYEVIFG